MLISEASVEFAAVALNQFGMLEDIICHHIVLLKLAFLHLMKRYRSDSSIDIPLCPWTTQIPWITLAFASLAPKSRFEDLT